MSGAGERLKPKLYSNTHLLTATMAASITMHEANQTRCLTQVHPFGAAETSGGWYGDSADGVSGAEFSSISTPRDKEYAFFPDHVSRYTCTEFTASKSIKILRDGLRDGVQMNSVAVPALLWHVDRIESRSHNLPLVHRFNLTVFAEEAMASTLNCVTMWLDTTCIYVRPLFALVHRFPESVSRYRSASPC